MPPLTATTEARIAELFAPEDRALAQELLIEECGNNLPFLDKVDSAGMDRFRLAALQLSGGDLGKLRSAIQLAKTDWRDLLMAAGSENSPPVKG